MPGATKNGERSEDDPIVRPGLVAPNPPEPPVFPQPGGTAAGDLVYLPAPAVHYRHYIFMVQALEKVKNLPVPVLADAARGTGNSPSSNVSGEARESTENCDRKGAAREICSMADSRGGQTFIVQQGQDKITIGG